MSRPAPRRALEDDIFWEVTKSRHSKPRRAMKKHIIFDRPIMNLSIFAVVSMMGLGAAFAANSGVNVAAVVNPLDPVIVEETPYVLSNYDANKGETYDIEQEIRDIHNNPRGGAAVEVSPSASASAVAKAKSLKEKNYEKEVAAKAKAQSEAEKKQKAEALKNKAIAPNDRLGWPTTARSLTDSYGPRIHPVLLTKDFHTGSDFGLPCGSPVFAAESGTVKNTGWSGGYGNRVVIEHSSKLSTTYSHLSSFKVAPGDIVEKGDVIASIGTTGYSTGCHLHFEVMLNNNRYTDPMPWLRGGTTNQPDYVIGFGGGFVATSPRASSTSNVGPTGSVNNTVPRITTSTTQTKKITTSTSPKITTVAPSVSAITTKPKVTTQAPVVSTAPTTQSATIQTTTAPAPVSPATTQQVETVTSPVVTQNTVSSSPSIVETISSPVISTNTTTNTEPTVVVKSAKLDPSPTLVVSESPAK